MNLKSKSLEELVAFHNSLCPPEEHVTEFVGRKEAQQAIGRALTKRRKQSGAPIARGRVAFNIVTRSDTSARGRTNTNSLRSKVLAAVAEPGRRYRIEEIDAVCGFKTRAHLTKLADAGLVSLDIEFPSPQETPRT